MLRDDQSLTAATREGALLDTGEAYKHGAAAVIQDAVSSSVYSISFNKRGAWVFFVHASSSSKRAFHAAARQGLFVGNR